MRLGVPLSVARGARLPGSAWTRRDWALAQAVEMLDRIKCPKCRQPTWLAHDKDTRNRWKVSATRCYACDAVASKEKGFNPDNTHNIEALYFGAEYLG